MDRLNAMQIFVDVVNSGGFSAAASWPPGIPPGTEAYFQFFVDDPSVIWGLTLSNAVRGTTP